MEKAQFSFTFPEDAPVSTVMQRLSPDAGDTCGVRYYVRCYASVDTADEHNTVSVLNFPIRKVLSIHILAFLCVHLNRD